MFNDYYLSLTEKFILFLFNIRSMKKSKFKRNIANDALLFNYQFLEVFSPLNSPQIVRISEKGKKYLRYRREKRMDRLILPVTVSVSASVIATLLINFLL